MVIMLFVVMYLHNLKELKNEFRFKNDESTIYIHFNLLNSKSTFILNKQNTTRYNLIKLFEKIHDETGVTEELTDDIINLMTKANYKIAELPPGQYKNELTKLLGDQATPDQLREKHRSLTDERDALYNKYS